MPHRFMLGVEEEFQIVDPQTWDLKSHVAEFISPGTTTLGNQVISPGEPYDDILEELQMYADTQDFKAVVAHLVRETKGE